MDSVQLMHVLRMSTKNMVTPAALEVIRLYGKDPYLVLVSCILSLKTKDTVSLPASIRLFDYARNPQDFLRLEPAVVERLIYPVGFYRQKTKQLFQLSQQLLQEYDGVVPHTKEQLMNLSGVGLKTANLVLSLGFGIPAICVDTHVHRIVNRLGLVLTATPEETENALKKVLPEQYWIECNTLLVQWGQNMCVARKPFCSLCPLLSLCKQKEVKKHR